MNTTLTRFDNNTEAVTPNHDVVEIESIGERLGSKYYGFNEKDRNLVDAEDKKIQNSTLTSNTTTEAKEPEATNKTKTESQNAPKPDDTSKATNAVNRNNVNAEKSKGQNLRVKIEENLIEKENIKRDLNGLKVQKIRILPIRRMSADA